MELMEDKLYELFLTLDPSAKNNSRRWFKSDGTPSNFFSDNGKLYSRNPDGTVKTENSK